MQKSGWTRRTWLVALGVALQIVDELVEVLLLAFAIFEGLSLEFGVVSLMLGQWLKSFRKVATGGDRDLPERAPLRSASRTRPVLARLRIMRRLCEVLV